MGRLTGKVAIVTGAARGMGAAEAALFAREGACVLLCDILGTEAVERAEQLNAALGDNRVNACLLDVSDAAHWARAVSLAEEAWGRIDILVNNAGVIAGSGLMEADEAEWDRLVSVNQKGVWLGMRAVVPAMRARGGGSIVNISSIGGIVGTSFQTIYHGTKGAVRLLSKAAAANLAPHGIRVNSVHPGLIRTAMVSILSSEELDAASKAAPIGRIGEPEEVAYAALFLASDESSFVTGSELVVDGGFTAI